jgi:hypothetical protein
VTSGGSSWADPSSAGPYAGPPPTGPAAAPPYGYGAPPVHGAPYPPGYPSYGYPWPVPAGPGRPGQVIAAAVLAFAQGALVLLSSVCVLLFSSLGRIASDTGPSSAPLPGVDGLAAEGTALGIVQVVSAVLLVVGGVLVLNSRRRRSLVVLVAAFAVQVLLCAYWAVRLSMLAPDFPGSDPSAPFLAFPLLFLAGPAVGLGLVLLGSGRRWFDGGSTR